MLSSKLIVFNLNLQYIKINPFITNSRRPMKFVIHLEYYVCSIDPGRYSVNRRDSRLVASNIRCRFIL